MSPIQNFELHSQNLVEPDICTLFLSHSHIPSVFYKFIVFAYDIYLGFFLRQQFSKGFRWQWMFGTVSKSLTRPST